MAAKVKERHLLQAKILVCHHCHPLIVIKVGYQPKHLTQRYYEYLLEPKDYTSVMVQDKTLWCIDI